MVDELAKKSEGAALAVFGEDEKETGFENTKAQDYAIPFLVLLQKGSPQCDADKAEYLPAAQPGMFFDSSTGELLPEVQLIPCHYKQTMVQWHPREDGGGFVAAHEPGVEVGLKRNDKGQFVMEDGTVLVDTRSFFCLRLTADGAVLPTIVSFTSTQIKKARTWLTRMQAIKVDGKNGKFTPPMWAHIWKFTAVGESKDQYTWKGYKIEMVSPVQDANHYNKAKEMREVFQNASTVAAPPKDEFPGE